MQPNEAEVGTSSVVMTCSTKPSAPRVRRHRQQLRAAGNVRLEVSIGADDEALTVCHGLPVWVIVQEALIAHVAGNKP